MKKTLGSPLVTALICAAIALCYTKLFPVMQPDYFGHYLPWVQAIKASDGLWVFATDFTNYTGGIVTILALFTLLEPVLSELAIIKLTALSGVCLCALGVATCLRAADWAGLALLNAALLFMLLPSVMVNGIAWAQGDSFYTAFVLFSMAAVLGNRLGLAVLMFIIAVSIKLQAMFFAPFLLGIFLKSPKYILLGCVLMLPVYLLVNSLYLLAGRPVEDVVLIYFDQTVTFDFLSMNAANPWILVDRLAHYKTKNILGVYYTPLIIFGIVVAALVGCALAWYVRRSARDAITLLSLAAITTILIPFILPKMHDRFFFMGEVFLFLVCLLDRRYLPAAISVQVSALLMYSIYHDTFGISTLITERVAVYSGLLMMVCTLLALFLAMRIQRKKPDAIQA